MLRRWVVRARGGRWSSLLRRGRRVRGRWIRLCLRGAGDGDREPNGEEACEHDEHPIESRGTGAGLDHLSLRKFAPVKCEDSALDPTRSHRHRLGVATEEGRGTAPAEIGVYYAENDVAGLAARLVALGVDVLLVAIVWGVLSFAVDLFELPQSVANVPAFVLAWVYLAWLKRSPVGTLGYRLCRLQVVDLSGERVSLASSTARFLFLFWGPLNFLIDLIWLSHDANRQSLRDKIVGTYVVRRGAGPVGSGPISYPTYFVATLSFVVPEVQRQLVSERSS